MATHEDFLQISDSKSIKCVYILSDISLNTISIKFKLLTMNNENISDGFIIFMGNVLALCAMVNVA